MRAEQGLTLRGSVRSRCVGFAEFCRLAVITDCRHSVSIPSRHSHRSRPRPATEGTASGPCRRISFIYSRRQEQQISAIFGLSRSHRGLGARQKSLIVIHKDTMYVALACYVQSLRGCSYRSTRCSLSKFPSAFRPAVLAPWSKAEY